MERAKRILIVILIVVILLAVAYFIGFRKGKIEEKPNINSTTVEAQIQSINELASSSYYYTNVGIFENQNEIRGFKIPLTQKRFMVSYDGTIKAGLDLDQVKVRISGNNIEVELPQTEILSHEIDEDSLQVFDEKNSIFNPIEVDDFNDFSKDQKEVMEDKAISSGLLDEAKEEAKKSIEEVLNLNEEINEEYTINFYFPRNSSTSSIKVLSTWILAYFF